MNKAPLVIVLLGLLLTACATNGIDTFNPKTTVRSITVATYPELPDIEPVEPVNLIPWTHDFPRDQTKVTVKNLSDCINVPEDKRDDSFWDRCGEHPIIPDSNIYIGFDQKNWSIILEDFARLRETIHRLRARMDVVNKQRADWRAKAEAERAKARAEEAKTKAAADAEPK